MSSDQTATFLKKFEPADLIATIVIIGCFILKFLGDDGLVSTLLTGIVFYYFGKRGRPYNPTYEKITNNSKSDQKT